MVNPSDWQSVPFPVQPQYRMRPDLQRLETSLVDVLAPDGAWPTAQKAVQLAIERGRLPVVDTVSGAGGASILAALLEAQAMLGPVLPDQAAVCASTVNSDSVVSLARALRLGLQDDFVLMMQDSASVDSTPGSVRARLLAVAMPSGWDPVEKVGQSFVEIHRSVADATLIQQAAQPLSEMMLGPSFLRRHVWTLANSPSLSRHPADDPGPLAVQLPDIWFRCERQTSIGLPGAAGALFLIRVYVAPLLAVLALEPGRASRLRLALASMSPAVVAYKGLEQMRSTVLRDLPDN